MNKALKEVLTFLAIFITVGSLFFMLLFGGIGIWPYKEIRSPEPLKPDLLIKQTPSGLDTIYIYHKTGT